MMPESICKGNRHKRIMKRMLKNILKCLIMGLWKIKRNIATKYAINDTNAMVGKKIQ